MINQYTPPCSVEWFQRRLNRLTRNHSTRLRIAWPPLLTEMRVTARDQTREYMKYPLFRGEFRTYVKGCFFQRRINGRLETVGYQKQGGLVVGNVLPTDISVPDIERENPSIHIFVLEEKRADQYARAVHARKQELAIKNLGYDIYGEFPREGIWDWWADISEHRDECCAVADAIGVRCRGLYREPNGGDLELVRRALKQRAERKRAADPQAQIEQAALDIRAGIMAYREKLREERSLMGREMDRLARRAIERPSVYHDSDKRDPRLKGE